MLTGRHNCMMISQLDIVPWQPVVYLCVWCQALYNNITCHMFILLNLVILFLLDSLLYLLINFSIFGLLIYQRILLFLHNSIFCVTWHLVSLISGNNTVYLIHQINMSVLVDYEKNNANSTYFMLLSWLNIMINIMIKYWYRCWLDTYYGSEMTSLWTYIHTQYKHIPCYIYINFNRY